MIYPAWNVQCYLDPAVFCFDFDHFSFPAIAYGVTAVCPDTAGPTASASHPSGL